MVQLEGKGPSLSTVLRPVTHAHHVAPEALSPVVTRTIAARLTYSLSCPDPEGQFVGMMTVSGHSASVGTSNPSK